MLDLRPYQYLAYSQSSIISVGGKNCDKQRFAVGSSVCLGIRQLGSDTGFTSHWVRSQAICNVGRRIATSNCVMIHEFMYMSMQTVVCSFRALRSTVYSPRVAWAKILFNCYLG